MRPLIMRALAWLLTAGMGESPPPRSDRRPVAPMPVPPFIPTAFDLHIRDLLRQRRKDNFKDRFYSGAITTRILETAP